ncbi:MAG: helix-turn-helix transcriptional regulator [Lewinella sp.]|nr:helix-turn-helix transcriptional regulator [Lewinella sp.]
MSVHKRMRFSERRQELALLHQAFSHPARLYICELLAENGPASFDFILRHMPLAKSTVSHHLRKLEKVQLVAATEEMGEAIYALRRESCQWGYSLIDGFWGSLSPGLSHDGPFSLNNLPLAS